jgi:hypothetical protein
MLLHSITVTVLRGGGTDDYGDPISGGVQRISVPGCAVAPRAYTGASSVSVDDRGRQGVIVGLTLYPPKVGQIRHTDNIEIAGVSEGLDGVFTVEGEPGDWISPYTGRTGCEVALRRAEG